MHIRTKPYDLASVMFMVIKRIQLPIYPYADAGGYEKEIGLGPDIVLKLISVVSHP